MQAQARSFEANLRLKGSEERIPVVIRLPPVQVEIVGVGEGGDAFTTQVELYPRTGC